MLVFMGNIVASENLRPNHSNPTAPQFTLSALNDQTDQVAAGVRMRFAAEFRAGVAGRAGSEDVTTTRPMHRPCPMILSTPVATRELGWSWD
jgi:hypothetical protein